MNTNFNQFIVYWNDNQLSIGKRDKLPKGIRVFGIKNTYEEAEEYIQKYKKYREKLNRNNNEK